MKWDIGQASVSQCLFVHADSLEDILILIMKNQSQQVIFRFLSSFS